jgi:hypothetical protein
MSYIENKKEYNEITENLKSNLAVLSLRLSVKGILKLIKSWKEWILITVIKIYLVFTKKPNFFELFSSFLIYFYLFSNYHSGVIINK